MTDNVDNNSVKPLKVGLAGLGVVGSAVATALTNTKRLPVQLAAVSSRNLNKNRPGVDLSGSIKCENALELIRPSEIDVLVEVIGGSEGIARELVTKALQSKIPVVTANKALLATHGKELAQIAHDNGVEIRYEAAVAGGLPVVQSILRHTSVDKITKVEGILNGTCNFILSCMEDTRSSLDDAVALAQAQGFAEADPTLDIQGEDSAHKIAILAAIAFGGSPDLSKVSVKGIENITSADIERATAASKRIRLVATADNTPDGLVMTVNPTELPYDSPLSSVAGVFNAVIIHSEYLGHTMHVGPGAGGHESASAILGDLLDVAAQLSNVSQSVFGQPIVR